MREESRVVCWIGKTADKDATKEKLDEGLDTIITAVVGEKRYLRIRLLRNNDSDSSKGVLLVA